MMMSALRPDDTVTSSWQRVEDFLTSLHESARAQLAPHDFYQRLLTGCIETLAAEGGAVWQPVTPGKWRPMVQSNEQILSPGDLTPHARIVQLASIPMVLPPGEDNPSEHAILIGAVADSESGRPRVVIELFMRTGASDSTHQGWQEFLTAVIHAADQFELHQQLRTLRADQTAQADLLAMLRCLHSGTTLQEVAFQIVNEGCRFLKADRLGLLLGRGGPWRLIAVSGVGRHEARSDSVKDLERLAESTANWGELIDYSEGAETRELPAAVVESLHRHIDHSHARQLVAVPVQLDAKDESKPVQASAVFIAEQFGKSRELDRQRVVELAQLCEPALQQVLKWDRWPVRPVLKWTNWATHLWHTWGLTRLGAVAAAAAIILLSLVFVRTDFEIEAQGTLMPTVVHDVFATSNGKVMDIKVKHGDQVKKGAVLAVLEDPQLDLESQRVRGELETVRQRLEAINVARTDRQTREEASPDRLPLSAEAKQLELQLSSLLQQSALLDKCREDLTLRSPIDGMVLTLDVQNLLQRRPVERGQVLFTVADTDSGWQLETHVPQDQVGHVLSAANSSKEALPVRFRLAGDRETTYSGHVIRIAETAILDTTTLEMELPDVRVDAAVDEKVLPAARPEMKAVVRLHCGRRSIGYVWLHDVWDNLYSWLAF